jgi:hypothetical protein
MLGWKTPSQDQVGLDHHHHYKEALEVIHHHHHLLDQFLRVERIHAGDIPEQGHKLLNQIGGILGLS